MPQFSIIREDLTDKQISAILNHPSSKKFYRYAGVSNRELDASLLHKYLPDQWHITIENGLVKGYSETGKFDIERYMRDAGIRSTLVEWT